MILLLTCVCIEPDANRVWDNFLWEGCIIIHRVGLAICKLFEAELLQCTDFASAYLVFKSAPDQLTEMNAVAPSSIFQVFQMQV